ncbi:MAG: amidase [Anderseniella sp.]|jgi:Asp-tRNA(Asn)/Glu-tRNA(Gln) amidotransferase A subunit family amidase|nr:amidase [Anderseniella sp.]
MTIASSLPRARDLARQLSSDISRIEGVLADCRSAVEAREAEIKAFRFLDWGLVESQRRELHRVPAERHGPLFGVPVAVKDIFDTADMPTSYGSDIYAGHRPSADAACVARLRAAGAIIAGKTVTTEFAFWHAGPTRNPHDTSRTPGGSSSGSCAGLAAGMFPLALGSQTAASTMRPAAFCGITGYKPSRHWISRAGVKALAGSTLDAVGVFGRCVDDVALLAQVMAGIEMEDDGNSSLHPPVIATWQGREWRDAEAYATSAVLDAADRLASAGANVFKVTPASDFDRLIDLQKLIMAREAACDLAWEHLYRRDMLSDTLTDFLDEGAAISAAGYQSALASVDDCKSRIDQLFGDADILAAPSAPGEAPLHETGTGNPDMSRAWTLLDLPSLTIPAGTGPSGLPLGLQLAARPGHDETLLGAARWIESKLGAHIP